MNKAFTAFRLFFDLLLTHIGKPVDRWWAELREDAEKKEKD